MPNLDTRPEKNGKDQIGLIVSLGASALPSPLGCMNFKYREAPKTSIITYHLAIDGGKKALS